MKVNASMYDLLLFVVLLLAAYGITSCSTPTTDFESHSQKLKKCFKSSEIVHMTGKHCNHGRDNVTPKSK